MDKPNQNTPIDSPRWSAAQAAQWYRGQPWLVGCNFTPSTAINQLEMWQAETFDPATIDRELGWAAGIGFNCVRVYLHDLAWEADPQGFLGRVRRYLEIAARRGIRTVFVIFDDCWNPNPGVGKQPDPIPGVHNSGWVQSPGPNVVKDPASWARLERYVTAVVGALGQDDRVLMWDLYNEPGNSQMGAQSLPLLQAAFGWARAAKPRQPLTAGVWFGDAQFEAFQTGASDIITFHNYDAADKLEAGIARLKAYGRPLVCTEYMRRPESTFLTHLPIFKRENVGCLNWGLVSGKTQTIYPWGSPKGAPEPQQSFHDIFHGDGKPYRAEEVAVIRELTGRGDK